MGQGYQTNTFGVVPMNSNYQPPAQVYPNVINTQQTTYNSPSATTYFGVNNQQNSTHIPTSGNQYLRSPFSYYNTEMYKAPQDFQTSNQYPTFQTLQSNAYVNHLGIKQESTTTNNEVEDNNKTFLSQGYIGRSNKKPKVDNRKKRTTYTSKMLFTLEKMYESKRFVTLPERAILSEDLGLSSEQVKVWFQNRRMKDKKKGL